MKHRLVYVELKTGHSDDGPAWITMATASKTGATLYSNGKAFRSLKGSGISANYFDIETGDEYWISGIKKNNQDRHWAGRGNIMIDHAAIASYLAETGRTTLPRNLIPTELDLPQQRKQHHALEHRSRLERHDDDLDLVPSSRNGEIKNKT